MEISDSHFLKLFAGIQLVKGATRATLLDNERGEFRVLPNSLADFAEICRKQTLLDVLERHSDQRDVLDSYVDFFLNNQYAFLTRNPSEFAAINYAFWDSPRHITNSRIDVDLRTDFIIHAFNYLSELNCFGVALYLKSIKVIAEIISVLEAIDDKSRIRYISINTEELIDDIAVEELSSFMRVSEITMSSKEIDFKSTEKVEGCIITKQPLSEAKRTAFIQAPNHELFAESQNWHSYYNRKVFIRADGTISNTREGDSFGIISKLDNAEVLKEIIAMPKFKEYWVVSSEQLPDCKDCEFRHNCVDTRTLSKNRYGYWTATSNCDYDPLTGQWAK